MPDPSDDDDDTDREPEATDQAKVGRLCELLHSATNTPDDCYFAIWDGWPHASAVMHQSAQMGIPNRTYYLLQGPFADLGPMGCARHRTQPSGIRVADRPRLVHRLGRRRPIGADAITINRLLSQPDLDIVTAGPDAGAPAQYARRGSNTALPPNYESRWLQTVLRGR
jgi:hypothetical protein